MTAKWSDDTPEKLRESLRREQGEEVAAFLEAFIRGDVGPERIERRGRRKDFAGVKAKAGPAISGMKPTGTQADARARAKFSFAAGDAQRALRRAVQRFGEDSPPAKEAAAELARAVRDTR